MGTAILHDPRTLKHKTIELLGSRLIDSLETPERITVILGALAENGQRVLPVNDKIGEHSLHSVTLSLINATHDEKYLVHLRCAHAHWVKEGHISEEESILPECFPTFQGSYQGLEVKTADLLEPKDIFARSGYYAFDMSAGIMRHTYESAIASAELATRAAYFCLCGRDALALCRPPGHHCDTKRAGGYCYINNAVIAAEYLLRAHQNRGDDTRVAILDLDYHHGNGTQAYFYDRAVRYVSIHGADEYPYYTGTVEEHGTGKGQGYNHNYPLPKGTKGKDYMITLKEAVRHILKDKPSHVVLSLGFDTFADDPLGSFDLYEDAYERIAYFLADAFDTARVRTCILLEGGYVTDSLGTMMTFFLNGWEFGQASYRPR